MNEGNLIENKRFFGVDFLTWLLAAGEARGGEIFLTKSGKISVIFANKILLTIDSEQVDYRGEISNLEGVRLALRRGMKVTEGKIQIKQGEREWHLSINAHLFQFRSVGLPKARFMNASELFFERVAFLDELCGVMDELFGYFLRLRLDKASWDKELKLIHEWLEWV